MKNYPKLLKSFLRLTSDDEKIPTDAMLDEEIELLAFHLHHVWPLFWRIIKKKVWFSIWYKWKKWTFRLLIFGIIVSLSYVAWVKVAEPILIIQERVEIINQVHQDLSKSPIPEENLRFMSLMMLLESGNNYKTISKNGKYWGAFQIGESGRKEVGIESLTTEEFLNDKDIQNWTMNKLMGKNYNYLKDVIKEYKIPKKGGVRIGNHIVTQSGLLAAAHLVGATLVIDFVKSGGANVAKDGNGVYLTKYFELNNIEIEL